MMYHGVMENTEHNNYLMGNACLEFHLRHIDRRSSSPLSTLRASVVDIQ